MSGEKLKLIGGVARVQGGERLPDGPVHVLARRQSRRSGPPAAIIVAPATFNTINKIAAGTSDNYALTAIAEGIGHGVPTVVVPFVNTAFARRAPFTRSIAQLRDEGIRVIYGSDDEWEPHEPGTGHQRVALFPWYSALEEAEMRAARAADAALDH